MELGAWKMVYDVWNIYEPIYNRLTPPEAIIEKSSSKNDTRCAMHDTRLFRSTKSIRL
jgi:hypothetical protein